MDHGAASPFRFELGVIVPGIPLRAPGSGGCRRLLGVLWPYVSGSLLSSARFFWCSFGYGLSALLPSWMAGQGFRLYRFLYFGIACFSLGMS